MEVSSDKRTRRVWLTAYAPVLLWAGFIFLMSSGIGSASETSRIIRPLLEFLFPAANAETLAYWQWLIRKLAHFTEYSILGVLAVRMFRDGVNSRRWAASSAAFVAVIACVDELHQSVVASRTASAYDIGLDVAGGVFAISFCWFLLAHYSNR